MNLLRFFPDARSAKREADSASRERPVEIIRQFPQGLHLKERGAANIEPLFLCDDGEWRRYDEVAEFAEAG